MKKMQEIIEDYKKKQSNNNSKNSTQNEITQKIENKLEENYLYQKNQESNNIRNIFWNYFHKKEKEFLIKRKENRDEDCEDNFYIDACNVCNVEDMGIYNNLYECKQCGIRVHQLSYRIKTNQDPQKWKCSKCKAFSSKEINNIECLLCPVKGGTMQRTKISKDSKFYQEIMDFRKGSLKNNYNHTPEYIKIDNEHQDYPWIHLSCALSNSDVKIDIFDK